MIKELIKKGYKQCEISSILDIKKEKVSYWARHDLRTSQKKCKKLKDIYIQAIQRWANNKVTRSMSSRKIATKINSVLSKRNEVDKNGKPITVHFTTANNYLKQYFGKPRKIRKVFFMSKENKKKIIAGRKADLIETIVSDQYDKYNSQINTKLWERMHIETGDAVQTDSFFTTIEDYL